MLYGGRGNSPSTKKNKMNNNTKAAYKLTSGKSGSNPRKSATRLSKHAKVARGMKQHGSK